MTSTAARDQTRDGLPITNFRALSPWMICEFLGSFTANLYLIGCYDFAKDQLHASESQRLWIMSAWGLSYILIAMGAGRVVEKLGPRAAAIAASVLTAATSLLALLVIAFPHIWVLVLVMIPFNLTNTTLWPAVESGITRSPGPMRLSSRLALYNLAWGSAGFLGIFTHGMLEDRAWWLVFAAAAASSAVAGLVLWWKGLPASMIGSQNVPDEAAGEHDLDTPDMQRRAARLLKMAWVANALGYTAMYVLLPTMTQLAGMALPGASNATLGILSSVWFVARFAGFAVTSRWTGWHYKTAWLIGPLVAFAACFALLLVCHNLWLFLLLQIPFGLCAALVYSASLYYAMHVSDGHGGHAALHEAIIGIGITAGPVIGALAGAGGSGQDALVQIALWLTGVLLAGTAALAWYGRTPSRAEVSQ